MAHDVYYRFEQTAQRARRLGARGGKATARNRREHTYGASSSPEEPGQEPASVPSESTAEAIALLDARYPWLRGAERSTPRDATADN